MAALSNHVCIPISTRVPPFSGVILIVSAADNPVRSRNVLDLRACKTVVEDKFIVCLHFIVAVEKVAKLGGEPGNIGLNSRVLTTVHRHSVLST
ncbi:MAG: hypothetical protein ABR557_05585 [Pyrinomonadaceae bacterium]